MLLLCLQGAQQLKIIVSGEESQSAFGPLCSRCEISFKLQTPS